MEEMELVYYPQDYLETSKFKEVGAVDFTGRQTVSGGSQRKRIPRGRRNRPEYSGLSIKMCRKSHGSFWLTRRDLGYRNFAGAG